MTNHVEIVTIHTHAHQPALLRDSNVDIVRNLIISREYAEQRNAHQDIRQHSNSKQVHEVDFHCDADLSEEEYMYSIKEEKHHPLRKLLSKINGILYNFLLDTCASVNVLDQAAHVKISSPKLEKETNPALLPHAGEK